jgi:enterochelin esterase-like enzyme
MFSNILHHGILMIIPTLLFSCHHTGKPKPDINAQKNDIKNVQFQLKARKNTEKIFLAGSFNEWNPDACPMLKNADSLMWTVSVPLKPGLHQYKFILDDKDWITDPENNNKIDNGIGGFNSIISTDPKKFPIPEEKQALTTPEPDPDSWSGVKSIPSSIFRGWKISGREIYIWLPPSYNASTEKRFPVLYMHDGQNIWDEKNCCFGHGGWYVNSCAENLISEKKIRKIIIVGIPNSSMRTEELGVGENVFDISNHTYTGFITDILKPYIDKNYKTLSDPANTSIMGSSMGGISSFLLVHHHPDIFGSAACLSTAFGMDIDKSGSDLFDLQEKKGKLPVRIYMDSGTEGEHQDGAPDTRRMVKVLKKAGYKPGKDLLHIEDTGAMHNEKAWRSRLHLPLEFMFGK